MSSSRPLNVLFITVDQWRGDTLGIGGHPLVQTPHLDRLARDGVRFARHFAQTAPCGPSRASLYTGTYQHTHRVALNGTPLDARFTNVAKEARTAGYDPALFGYTDQTVDPRTVAHDDPRLFTYEGVLPGFTPVVVLPEHVGPWLTWLATKGYEVPEDPFEIYRPADPDAPPYASPTVYAAEHTEAAFLVEELTGWIAGRGDAPWFAHASFLRPHPPVIAPEPYHSMYDPASVPMPVRGATPDVEAALHPLVAGALHVPEIAAPRDDRDLRQLRATYYGMQTEVDAQLGRLFEHLERMGHWADTLVVLTSDHGEMLGDHWFVEKFGFFDGSYHIPLIIRDPRAAADTTRGSVVTDFTENVDVMPTILRAIGCPIPRQCEGHALNDYLHGDPPARIRSAAHWEWEFRDPKTHLMEDAFGISSDECNLAVYRDDDFKYVHFAAFDPILFDLRVDPGELVNVAGEPAYAATVSEYARRMLSWRLAHSERTLTGFFVDEDGLTARNDEPA